MVNAPRCNRELVSSGMSHRRLLGENAMSNAANAAMSSTCAQFQLNGTRALASSPTIGMRESVASSIHRRTVWSPLDCACRVSESW